MMYRQGDVLIEPCAKDLLTYATCIKRKRGEGIILAAGEATGHHHRIRDSRSSMYSFAGRRFLRVSKNGADLTHEEHDTIHIAPGTYEIKGQREYDPPATVDKSRTVTAASSERETRRVWD